MEKATMETSKATLEQNSKSYYLVLMKSDDNKCSVRTIRGDEPLGNYMKQGIVIPLAKYPPHEV